MSYRYGKQKRIIDTLHKNPFNKRMCTSTLISQRGQRKLILDNIRDESATLIGSSSAGLQVPEYLRKKYTDFDVLTKNKALPFALETEQELDQFVNHNCFYITVFEHNGINTYRIRNRCKKGTDGKDDVVADISSLRGAVSTTIINGIKVETLSAREKALRKLIASTGADALYRRKKDLLNLSYTIKYRKYYDNLYKKYH